MAAHAAGLTVILVGVVPAPLFAPIVTPVGEPKLPVEGLIVPADAATTGTEMVQVAVPEAIVPPEKVIVLPEIVAVPPHEFVTVAPGGKFRPVGNV